MNVFILWTFSRNAMKRYYNEKIISSHFSFRIPFNNNVKWLLHVTIARTSCDPTLSHVSQDQGQNISKILTQVKVITMIIVTGTTHVFSIDGATLYTVSTCIARSWHFAVPKPKVKRSFMQINPNLTSVFTHCYNQDESSLILRGFRCDFKILFHFSMKFFWANKIAPDGTPRFCRSLYMFK